MNTEPSRHQIERPAPAPPGKFVEAALAAASQSPCQSKRGVALFSMNRDPQIVSIGYNYKPRGFACDGSDACKATCREEALHAEQVALVTAGVKANGCDCLHVKSVNGGLVPSGGPSCVACSKLLLACGVVGVWLYDVEGWDRYQTHEFHRLSLENSQARARRERDHETDVLRTQHDFLVAEVHKHVPIGLDMVQLRYDLDAALEELDRLRNGGYIRHRSTCDLAVDPVGKYYKQGLGAGRRCVCGLTQPA